VDARGARNVARGGDGGGGVEAETRRILAAAGRIGVILGADCTVPSDTDWQRFEWVRSAAGEA